MPVIKRVIWIFVAVGLLAGAALGLDAGRFFTSPLHNTSGQLVTVESGMSFNAIAARLVEEGVIVNARDARYLSLYARYQGVANRIKAGEYAVPARQTPAHLLELLVSGKTRQYRITLVEGRRFSEIRQLIESNDALDQKLTGKSEAEVMAAIGHPDEQAEGRFMPDTYLFPRGMTDIAFLKRAYDAMQTFLDEAWENRSENTVVETPYEALILASIIEKETAVPEERGRIAGVFTRRLEKGMRLQTDPTVIYGIEDYDGNIRRSDLRRDTPYNTYTRTGLPPTPIAMPSRAAIKAALDPAPGDALYFVSRGDGSHVFSDSLSEHNRAVDKYQRGS
ncbi:endolytic transglycosylase MltG [Endozoicomonas sp. G2_2]|uniref:endolytic transglycosylase MltG n=1 Tax=Endozoicomonas sp. G2_2 TaxID=2821092 RepID=UPI001ADB21BA|nr:endolytic transglycosylase MltG [Endozoicomonas sp. G2_2]